MNNSNEMLMETWPAFALAVCQLQSGDQLFSAAQPGCKKYISVLYYEPINLQFINIISFVHYIFQYFDWETHKISWKFMKNSLLRVWNLTVVIPCVDSIKAKSHRHCIGELSWWIWNSSGSPAKFRVWDVDNNSIKLLVNSLSTIISNI